MEIVTDKIEKKPNDELSYNEANDLIFLLTRQGYNTKVLPDLPFLDLHYLKLKIKKALKTINEGVNELAKEMDHEVVPIDQNNAEFKLVKINKDSTKEYLPATQDFIDKKALLEKQRITGLKLNFMKLEDFRKWAENMSNQFDLTEYLLSEEVPVEEAKAA